MSTSTKEFTFPVVDIRLSNQLAEKFSNEEVMKILTALHPQLAHMPADNISHFDPEKMIGHGTGAWDRNWKYKSLCVVSENDRPPPDWRHDAVFEHLRPVITIYTKADGTYETIMHHRRFIKKGWKGHSHGRYNPNDPSKFMEAEDAILVPGTLEELTDEQVKAQYNDY